MPKRKAEAQLSPVEKLQNDANRYLENAVNMGRVTLSSIRDDKTLAKYLGESQKYVGETVVNLPSGARITKQSTGDIQVQADVVEGDNEGKVYTTALTADIIGSSFPVVTERFRGHFSSRLGGTVLSREIPKDGTISESDFAMGLLSGAIVNQKPPDAPPPATIKTGYRQMPKGLVDLKSEIEKKRKHGKAA